MKRSMIIPMLLLGALAWETGRAQTVTLSLKEALSFALKNNSNARAAKLDVENGNYQIEEVRAGALPNVSGSASLVANPILQQSALDGTLVGQPGETILVTFGQKWNANAGVNLSQTLFDQSVFTGLKAAKATRDYYVLNGTMTDEQVIEQVATAYYQVLVQRQKIEVVDSNLAITQRVYDIINGQFQNGLAKKIDLDRTRVNISNLKTQRQQLINAVQQQENALKYYMGMSIETPIDLPQEAYQEIDPQPVLLEDSLNMNSRTEMALLKKQNELLQFQKQAYEAEYYPTLSVSGNYSYQGLGNKFPLFKGASKGVNWFDYSSISLNLKVPIFNGFATRSRIRQAQIDIEKNEENLRNTKLSLDLAYQNAKTQINNSLITLENQKENVTLAEQVFENSQNNYNNGLAPLTDLLDARSALTEAQNNYSAAVLDYRLAEIQLIKAQGQLKTLLN